MEIKVKLNPNEFNVTRESLEGVLNAVLEAIRNKLSVTPDDPARMWLEVGGSAKFSKGQQARINAEIEKFENS